jgi:phage shock protein PspC (stress-responsive transcriptional regulator)
VSGALGRATNTDPVMWRVLLAVLGFFGGVGVLVYLIGWLAIPSEGETASPIESLFGRGRSGMNRVSVVALGAAAVLTFAFIVNDGFRATLLAVAVIVGAALLLRRNGWAGLNTRSSASGPAAGPPPPWAPGGPERPTAGFGATGPAAAAGTTTATAPTEEPPTAPLPPTSAGYQAPRPPTSAGNEPPAYRPAGYPPPTYAPPTSGYRPPFAPHGPWAGTNQPPYGAGPPPTATKPPKPPRERSKLGRITFFAVLFVVGMLALIDVAGVTVTASAYFAAVLTTIALGLIIGAWFGRARGLIFLAILATVGLLASSGVERWGGQVTNNVYRPQSLAAVADRYEFSVGSATLDLRAVNFTGAQQDTTIAMKLGQVRVLLPDNVDTTATVDITDGGRALLFGREWNDKVSQQVTDLGADGAGGGDLRLNIELNAGNVEVSR